MKIPSFIGCSQPFPLLSFYCVPSLFHRLFLVWPSPDSLRLFCSLRWSFSTHDWKANGAAGPQCDHQGKLVSACAGVIVAGVEHTLDNQVHNKALCLRTASGASWIRQERRGRVVSNSRFIFLLGPWKTCRDHPPSRFHSHV